MIDLVAMKQSSPPPVTRARSEPFDFETLAAKLGSGAANLSLSDKHPIYATGDPADSLFYVAKGRVKLAVFAKGGREAIVGLCDVGQFFGEGCLIANHPLRLSDAAAVGPATVVRIDKRSIVRLLREDIEFANKFIFQLLARNKRVEEDLVDQLLNSSEKRLARILLLLANFGTEDEPPPTIPPLSQETLAQMIGASRPKVSQFMNKFRKLGFIEYNGDVRVHKSLLNVVLRD